jgi:PAS domain S-box-containing protein
MKTRVLVVEDNPVVIAMIRQFLKKSDCSIVGTAATGEQAVALAAELLPDVALMDVELAGEMDGIEAARLIWNQFQVPVVYLTANDDFETVSRAASNEAFGYLHKPVQERELVSSIEIALHKHQAEVRIKEQEEWLRTTLECIADAVIAADSVGCVKLINPAAEALTGWRRKEAIGRDLLDVFNVLDRGTRQPAECAVLKVIRDGANTGAGQAKILRSRDGTEAIVEERAAPIINHSGQIVGVVLVFRDIGRQAEAA